jgi:hypothetical protein
MLSTVELGDFFLRLSTHFHDRESDAVSCLGISQDEMTHALATMRVDYDQIQIKNLSESKNPILDKRKKQQPVAK